MKKPLFTIAIISYNSEKYIRQAIESVLASNFTDFELLISDDASTDDTWSIIQEYDDLRIHAWRNDFNIGEYPNRNRVLQKATGKYLLFVDGDDVLYKNTLRNLSEFIFSFPESGMVWGLNPQNFPFFIFPYLVHPRENLNLIYRTRISISNIGFGEILFKVDFLRMNGGLSEKYKMGDTFIKKKLALKAPVLYVPIGMIFWRQSEKQASKHVTKGFDAFYERYLIDIEILNDPSLPLNDIERNIVLRNLRISTIKLLFSSTILKGDIRNFLKMKQKLKLPLSDLLLLFGKGKYVFKPSMKLDEPLFNNYNFINHENE
jgi:glycosyltransferase involved in cell wall biosynthesis